MVYKKYIEKDGKLYGPYVYRSRRVDGKVISDYYGADKSNHKKSVYLILGALILFALIFSFFIFKGRLTGNVVLNEQLDSGIENTEENLSLSLREGELIPASSKVVFETNEQTYEYILNDLILNEQSTEGDYYIEQNPISGSGEGYGLKGMKKIYPEISFTLILKQAEVIPDEEDEEPETEVEIDEPEESTEEETPAVQSDVEPVVEDTETEEEPEGTPVVQEVIDTEEPEGTPIVEDTKTEEVQEEETSAEEEPETEVETDEPEESSEASVPAVLAFFLGLLRTTGFVTSSNFDEIQGKVSANQSFTYNLGEGETLELLSGSVKSGDNSLDDNSIIISRTENKILIETNYFESEAGFGEPYLGNSEKTIYIKTPQEVIGKGAIVKILYSDIDLLSLEQTIEEPEELLNTSIENKTVIEIVETNALTEQERQVLLEKFEDASVQTIKSELFNGRYIIGYKIGDYKIEYSYDSNLSESVLKSQMEKDRTKWIRNILNTLSQGESVHEEVSQFYSNFSL